MKKVYGFCFYCFDKAKGESSWRSSGFYKRKKDAVRLKKGYIKQGYPKESMKIEVYAKIGEIKPKKGKP